MFVEDLTPLFADFGVDGTLDGEAVRVIFDDPSVESFGGPGMSARGPQVQIATASVPAAYQDVALVIAPQAGVPGLTAGFSGTVREHVADGTGLSVLLLRRA